MAMRDSSSKYLLNLSLYSMFRNGGASPFQALDAVDQGGDLIDAQAAELALVADKDNARAQEIVNSVASGVAVASAVVACIPSGITQIVGAVGGIIAGAVSYLSRVFNVEADKYNFLSTDANNLRRSCVGLNVAPAALPLDGNGKVIKEFNYVGWKGLLAHHLHDGYAVNSPKVTDADHTTGRIQGVVAKGSKRSRNVWKYWQKKYGPPGLSQADWDKRSNAVHNIINWIDKKFADKELKIMDDILGNDKNDEARRQRGSIWYASLLYMVQDLYDCCNTVGWVKSADVMRQLGHTKAATIAAAYVNGKPAGDKDVRGYQIALQLGYRQMRECLKAVGELSQAIIGTQAPARRGAPVVRSSHARAAETQALLASGTPKMAALVAPTVVRGEQLRQQQAVIAARQQQAVIAARQQQTQDPLLQSPPTSAKKPWSTQKKVLVAGGATAAGAGLLALLIKALRI